MSLASLVQGLVDFANECDQEYRGTDLEGDPAAIGNPEALAIVLGAIRDCRADLQALYGEIERDLLALAGHKRFMVEGFGEVEIKKSTKRNKWDHEGLTRTLVAMAADERRVNEETGEYEREADAVARVLTECAGIGYWRVTPLRARHIQVDEYCHEESDGWSVKLPSRKD